MKHKKQKNKKPRNTTTAIEPFISVVVTLHPTDTKNDTFQTAKKLENLGLDVIAVYDNTFSIYGKCTPTTMGVMLANSRVKSVEQNTTD